MERTPLQQIWLCTVDRKGYLRGEMSLSLPLITLLVTLDMLPQTLLSEKPIVNLCSIFINGYFGCLV